MGNPRLPREVAEKRYKLIERFLQEGHPPPGVVVNGKFGAIAQAALHDKKPRGSSWSWYMSAHNVMKKEPNWSLYTEAVDEPEEDDEVSLPQFADPNIKAEQVLDHLESQFQQLAEHEESKKWFEIKVKSDDAFGLAVVGDPHIGSNGTNYTLLRRDVKLMAKTDGVRAFNIGDTVDNWGGYLIRLYAENDVSKQTERMLSRWFLQESGIRWLGWLEGNHDHMSPELSAYMRGINAQKIPMLDWEAKFVLKFPSTDIRCAFAHNHKGTSIYNPLHGQKREVLWHGAEMADIVVAGHHHIAAFAKEETQDGRVVTTARVRGYKWIDNHATRHNFRNNEYGATMLFVINPTATCRDDLITPFMNLERGCDYLTYLRSR